MSDDDTPEEAPKRGFGMRNSGGSSEKAGGDADEKETEEQPLLSDDDTVDVGQEEASVHTHEVLDRLEKELVGLERRMVQPRFANARSVRNALERARLRQASRIVSDPSRKLTKGDLMRIEAEDILQIRVFTDDSPEDAESTADTKAP